MRRNIWGWIVTLALASLLAGSPPAHAWVDEDTWEMEVAFGSYQPAPDLLDNDLLWGLRAGVNFTQRFNVQTGVSWYRVTTPSQLFLPQVEEFRLEYEAFFLDFSLGYQFTPEKRWVTFLFLGPGFAAISADVDLRTPQVEILARNLDGNSFTLNAGAAGKITVGEKLYLGVMGRVRWIQDRPEDELDQEWTVSLGFVF